MGRQDLHDEEVRVAQESEARATLPLKQFFLRLKRIQKVVGGRWVRKRAACGKILGAFNELKSNLSATSKVVEKNGMATKRLAFIACLEEARLATLMQLRFLNKLEHVMSGCVHNIPDSPLFKSLSWFVTAAIAIGSESRTSVSRQVGIIDSIVNLVSQVPPNSSIEPSFLDVILQSIVLLNKEVVNEEKKYAQYASLSVKLRKQVNSLPDRIESMNAFTSGGLFLLGFIAFAVSVGMAGSREVTESLLGWLGTVLFGFPVITYAMERSVASTLSDSNARNDWLHQSGFWYLMTARDQLAADLESKN